MTLKQLFKNVLIEVNKVEAASILLEDFEYWVNKAVQQRCNLDYNFYEVNQQLTDNLRVLKATAILPAVLASDKYIGIDEEIYEVILPDDYFHILGCTCYFTLSIDKGCLKIGHKHKTSATKMTSDMQGRIYENAYNKPSYKKPYFYLNHLNPSSSEYNSGDSSLNGYLLDPSANSIDLRAIKTMDRVGQVRYGNSSAVRLEMRCGDPSGYTLDNVYVEYLRVPQYLKLTQDQVDSIEDLSQVLEWPDYMCYEIIKELEKLLLENASDPRLSTNIPINQTIASPVQQQSAKK